MSSLKCSKDKVIVHVAESNDVHILDDQLRCLKVLPGVRGDSLDFECIRKSRFSNEGQNFIWFKGGGIVSLVDLSGPGSQEKPQVFDIHVPMSKNNDSDL